MDTGRRPPLGISADTTLREIAGMVSAPLPVAVEPMVVETVSAEAIAANRGIEESARSRRVPYLMTAVTAAAGWGAYGCAEAAAAIGGADTATMVGEVAWLATAAAVPVLRAVFRHRIPEAWRRRWWLATTAGAAWVDVAVAHGPASVGMTAALVLGAAVLGARWADEHQVPNPGDVVVEPAPLPVPALPPLPQIDTSRAANIEQDWEAQVASGAHPVAAGARLLNRTRLPHGYRWLVQLDRSGHVGATDLTAEGNAGRVALKLGMRATHVMLERLEGDADREDQTLLTVVTHDVLSGGVSYEGPRYDAGVIPTGRYADGTGTAHWTAHDAAGVRCGLVTGGQRSGKSQLLTLLGMAYRGSDEWLVLFGDGDVEGRSSPLLGQVAHDFARGPAEVLQQLEGLEALRGVRGPLMGTLTEGPGGKPTPMTHAGQEPPAKILPCRSYPGIVWILDEFHLLAGDPQLQAVNFVARVALVVRLLAKYGVGVVVGTHSSLSTDFDGDSAFRGMLAQGNRIALRSKNKSEHGIVDDGAFDPSSLPAGGGYAFSDDGVRQAMIRIEHSRDMSRWLPQVLPFGVPDPRSWAAYMRYRRVQMLDPVAAYHESQARLAEFDAAIATGAPLPGSPEAKAQATSEDEPIAAGHEAVPVSFGGFTVPAAVGGNVIALRPRRDTTAPPVPMEPMDLPTKASLVLSVLRSETRPWRSAEIIDETGLSGPDVSKALRPLLDGGLAHRPTDVQGVYAASTSSGWAHAST